MIYLYICIHHMIYNQVLNSTSCYYNQISHRGHHPYHTLMRQIIFLSISNGSIHRMLSDAFNTIKNRYISILMNRKNLINNDEYFLVFSIILYSNIFVQ
jgi:hypothetical protein